MNEYENKVFSTNLLFYMQKNNKTRDDVARFLNVSLPTMSNYLNGKRFPKIDKLQALSEYFGVTVSDLVQDRAQMWKQKLTSPEYVRDIWNRLDDMHTELLSPDSVPTWEGVPIDEKQRALLLKSIENLMDMYEIYK